MITLFWFICSIIMGGLLVHVFLEEVKNGYDITYGEVYIAIFITLLGPIALVLSLFALFANSRDNIAIKGRKK